MPQAGFESTNPAIELSKIVCAWEWQLEKYKKEILSL
jgi:hypothetical protein